MTLTFEERRRLRELVSLALLNKLSATPGFYCDWCGEGFEPAPRQSGQQRYCCKRCSQAAEAARRRERKRMKAAA